MAEVVPVRAEAIAELLPEVMRRTVRPGSVLQTLLGVAEQLHQPVEDVLADFDRYVDPYRCPPSFLPYLCDWVGLGWLFAGPTAPGWGVADEALRCVVARGHELAATRGTADGMAELLDLLTGMEGFAVESGPGPFEMTVLGPAGSEQLRGLVSRIVRHDKPAFAVARLVLGSDEPVELTAPPTRAGPADLPPPGARPAAAGTVLPPPPAPVDRTADEPPEPEPSSGPEPSEPEPEPASEPERASEPEPSSGPEPEVASDQEQEPPPEDRAPPSEEEPESAAADTDRGSELPPIPPGFRRVDEDDSPPPADDAEP